MSETPGHHLIVTGGTGYIGERMVDLALRQGRKVTVLGRKPGPAGTRHISWTLGDPLPKEAVELGLALDWQALVHLAHDWHSDDDRNVRGTKVLFDSARRAGLGSRVFVSSQSARKDALNRYGRMKWLAEQQIGDGASLRVGFVYGGRLTAMYGLLCRIAKLPVVPMVDPHRCIQPIHRDEVVQGILAAVDKSLEGVFALAGPDPVSFGDVLRAFARVYEGRRLTILPVPLRLALWGCGVTARVPLIPTIDRERVLGLAGTEPMDVADDLARLGVAVKPLARRLAQEPAARRMLLAEARAFLRYAGKVEPEPALMKRYVRACCEGAIVRPHVLLGWREPLGGCSHLGTRLRVAARVVETSARMEMALSQGSRTRRLAGLARIIILEAFKLPSRLVSSFLVT